jgi:predicted anti-sigma-YlaC factor YlaD
MDFPLSGCAMVAFDEGGRKVGTCMMSRCTDSVVGDILSSWRYDISGISPEMRVDYEEHLENCPYCRSRQRLHRVIDVTLIGLSTLSIVVFLLALAVIHHVEPLRTWSVVMHLEHTQLVLTLQAAAVLGLLASLVAWVLVAVATPAPIYLTGVAIEQARVLQDRIPEELRSRLRA